MQKLYENFYIFYFQKRIVFVETIRGWLLLTNFYHYIIGALPKMMAYLTIS